MHALMLGLFLSALETDLHQMIKKGTLKEDWKHGFIIFQLLSALAYIHSANVIHRDIKVSINYVQLTLQ